MPRKKIHRYGTGSISILPSGNVRLRFHEDGKWRSKTFKTKTEAESFSVGRSADMDRGVYISEAKKEMTFAEVGDHWLKSLGHVRSRTARDYKAIYKRELLPYFGKRKIGKIDRQVVTEWLSESVLGRSPATVRSHRAVLRLVFNTAISMQAIYINPCDGTKIRQAKHVEVIPLLQEEVAMIVDVIDPRFRAAILVAAFCGLRSGEIWALRYKSVDFTNKTLRVNCSDPIGGKAEDDDETKSRHSIRTVPVPGDVLKAIREHVVHYSFGPDGRIFSSPGGTRVDHSNFSGRVWGPALDRLNEEYRKTGGAMGMIRRPRLYDLRHTFVALKYSKGANVEQVRRWLGHSNQVMTERYSHLFPKDQVGADLNDIVVEVLKPRLSVVPTT